MTRYPQQSRLLHQIINGLQAALYVQLAIKAGEMIFNGLNAQSHFLCDGLIILAIPQEPEQFALAACQLFRGSVSDAICPVIY